MALLAAPYPQTYLPKPTIFPNPRTRARTKLHSHTDIHWRILHPHPHTRYHIPTLAHPPPCAGELAVLGVMLDAGAAAPLPVLDTVLSSAPNKTGVTVPLEKPISLLSMLPPLNENGRRAYARYDGSLTTPPCTEGVLWTVFLEPVKVQATQVREAWVGFVCVCILLGKREGRGLWSSYLCCFSAPVQQCPSAVGKRN